MNYNDQQIELLEQKIAEYKSYSTLNAAQSDVLAAMEAKVEELRDEIPPRPVTLERGPIGNNSMTTANRPKARGKDYRNMFGLASLQTDGFKSFNEFLTVLNSGKFDDRLRQDIQNSMSETVPSSGGFAVPEQYAAWLLDASLESEIVRPRATVWPMSSDSLKVPGWDASTHTSSLYGGLTGTWISELGASTEVTAKMRQIQMTAKKLACYTSASNELVADGIDLESQITQALVKTLGWYMDYAFIHGGAGQPLGILNDPALITVAKESGQTASTIIFENAVKLYSRLAPQCMENAVWLASQTCVPQLLTMCLQVGVGGSMLQPAVLQSSGKFSLLGKEVIFSEKLPALGSKGQLMLVDLSQYAIGLRKEISLDKSIHVGWTTDTSSYRAIVRVDGMGTWNAPITPKAGDTLSWCVALAA